MSSRSGTAPTWRCSDSAARRSRIGATTWSSRSPYNPTFYWGNFLLLDRVPDGAEATQQWLDRFAQEFPGSKHVAIGIDGTTGTPEDLQAFVDLGMTREVNAVMTATSVHPPPRPNTEAEYRKLESDADWEAQIEVRMAMDAGEVDDVESHRKFVVAKAETSRQLSEAGHGAWFGAFLDGELRSTMGLVRADTGLARFQNVETHPGRPRARPGRHVGAPRQRVRLCGAGRFDPGDGRRPGLPRDPGLRARSASRRPRRSCRSSAADRPRSALVGRTATLTALGDPAGEQRVDEPPVRTRVGPGLDPRHVLALAPELPQG